MDYIGIISTIFKYIFVVLAFAFVLNILKDILYYIKKESKEKIAILKFGTSKDSDYIIIRDEITVGRSSINDVSIDDDKISKRQFHIKKTKEGYLLEDLKSKNGTRLNGARVTKAILKNRDVIEVGNETIIYEEKVKNV